MNNIINNDGTDTENAAIKEEKKKYSFDSINGRDLMEMDLPPLQYTIEPILPHGFFILAGGAKVGKSWLAEQISYAVASGGKLWDFQATQSEVLYLGLEDTLSRLQSRFEMFDAYEGMENIHFVLRANSITSGLETDIREYLTAYPNIKLIVIDTLQHIRGNEYVKNIYAGDVEFTNILRQISVEFDLTILALTHTNKGKHDDEISKISGSEGMAGGTDGNWVLTKNKRTDSKANLTISNRDTEAFEYALEFDKKQCRWNKLSRDEVTTNDKEIFLLTIVGLMKTQTNHHWEGTATQLLEIIRGREPFLSTLIPATLSKKLKATEDTLRNIYGITYTNNFHNKQKWITLDYIELR